MKRYIKYYSMIHFESFLENFDLLARFDAWTPSGNGCHNHLGPGPWVIAGLPRGHFGAVEVHRAEAHPGLEQCQWHILEPDFSGASEYGGCPNIAFYVWNVRVVSEWLGIRFGHFPVNFWESIFPGRFTTILHLWVERVLVGVVPVTSLSPGGENGRCTGFWQAKTDQNHQNLRAWIMFWWFWAETKQFQRQENISWTCWVWHWSAKISGLVAPWSKGRSQQAYLVAERAKYVDENLEPKRWTGTRHVIRKSHAAILISWDDT